MTQNTYSTVIARKNVFITVILFFLSLLIGIMIFFLNLSYYFLLITILIGFIVFIFVIIPYRTRYIVNKDNITCKWIFGTKNIKFSEIIYIRSYTLPKKNFRVFGFPLIGGEYHNSEIGSFLIIYGGFSEGILIETDNDDIFGQQIFITPKNLNQFQLILHKKSGLDFNRITL